MIPTNLKKYFWDTDFDKLELNLHKNYIVERILELGDETAIKWLMQNFNKNDIAFTLNTSRKLSAKSLNFWKLALNK